ncbi:hypothetical protein Hypma_013240 [Hypsizygus marmoreus]|uniref:Chromo domain-containing protein n=1 Tax=Hypsizygus marmoreus TaxID=39966 RepID=A0A369JE60_HYPMA|nr:hypothetical protein Hypma_013240 [Hypsizygus marmoreus]
MPRYNGPYMVTTVNLAASMVTLNMPNSPNVFPTFHTSQVLSFHKNDADLFSSREFAQPGPILTADGQEEWLIDKIIDECWCGRGHQYLVQYAGYGPEENCWLPGSVLAENITLTDWLAEQVAD